MKTLLPFSVLFTLSALLSSPSYANASCPDLRGTYLCKQNSYRQDTHYNFDQVERNGTYLYMMSANPPGGRAVSYFEFLADGEYREVVDRITGQRLNMKAQCTGGAVEVSGTFTTDKGQIIRFAENLSLTAEADLLNVSLDINGNIVSEVCARVQ